MTGSPACPGCGRCYTCGREMPSFTISWKGPNGQNYSTNWGPGDGAKVGDVTTVPCCATESAGK